MAVWSVSSRVGQKGLWMVDSWALSRVSQTVDLWGALMDCCWGQHSVDYSEQQTAANLVASVASRWVVLTDFQWVVQTAIRQAGRTAPLWAPTMAPHSVANWASHLAALTAYCLVVSWDAHWVD
jgi:hypothetical protein